MMLKVVICIATIIGLVCSFRFSHTRHVIGKKLISSSRMSAVEETAVQPPEDVSTNIVGEDDFSKYAAGQQYDASVQSVKQFGVFVNIAPSSFNVLLPRSLLSQKSYDKLKKYAEDGSKESFKIELVGVSAENRTLSGKLVGAGTGSKAGYREKVDLAVIANVDKSAFYNATIISAHDFGVFASLDDYGVEGLVPASKLPTKLPASSIQKSYPAGSKVSVKIFQINTEAKKLVLDMKSAEKADVSEFDHAPRDKWFQAIVQRVADFGIFVRPAGFDQIGLVHFSKVPKELLSVLKKRAPVPSNNKTDIENLFAEGDVIKVRVNSVMTEARKLEFSMLPFRGDDEDDDEYVVEGRETEEEMEAAAKDTRDDDDDKTNWDAQDMLVWWRGAPYVKVDSDVDAEEEDEEITVATESQEIVQGTFRRLFEIDMREDEADFSAKAVEAELKELAEEIGELAGLDDDMVDSLGFGTPYNNQKFGSFVSLSTLPAEWKNELEYFKDFETSQNARTSILKGGKASEKAEFENLAREMDRRSAQMAASRGARSPEIEAPAPAVATLTAEAVAAPAPEESSAPAADQE